MVTGVGVLAAEAGAARAGSRATPARAVNPRAAVARPRNPDRSAPFVVVVRMPVLRRCGRRGLQLSPNCHIGPAHFAADRDQRSLAVATVAPDVSSSRAVSTWPGSAYTRSPQAP